MVGRGSLRRAPSVGRRAVRSLLEDDGDDLSEHDGGVSVKEGNAGETLTALEGLDDHGLARLKDNLGHLVSLEDGGLVQLLTSGLLSDLRLQGAGRAIR